jgi:hypothetical protein
VLQAGPAEATEAVVFVNSNFGSSQDWARLVERTGDQAGTALDAARPRPRPARQGDSAQACTNGRTTVSLTGTSGSQPVIRRLGSVTPCNPTCQHPGHG